ncbi:MAG: glycosyltransferase [Lachnospiraceae bacterium]|nr:glycosyltransferase [Lachnospiraceae bacterium]
MDNCEFKVQIIRRHLYNPNKLYVKGFYLSDVSEKSKVKFILDDTELNYVEEKISEFEIKNRYINEIENVVAGSEFWIDMPDLDKYNWFKVVLEDNNKEELKLPIDILLEMLTKSNYSIDFKFKEEDRLVVKGWTIHNHDVQFKLYDSNKKEIEAKAEFYNNDSVALAYPEINSKSKVTGFSISFDKNCTRYVQFVIKDGGNEASVLLDTNLEFDGNRSLIARFENSIKTKGIKGTVKAIFKRLSHPIKLFKSICRKLGITKVYHTIKSKIEIKQRYINETKLLKKNYPDLYKEYPNAARKLLCLSELDSIYDKKKVDETGDVKFSILVPLFNTPVQFLNEMIESVQIQTYNNWELCLADGSDDKHSYVKDIVKVYQSKDNRILYKKLDKNYGISGNTNECIKMASGDFIALFDHDDFLHPNVLKKCYEVIKSENADFVYTDEATFQIDLNNVITYHFKPDYAPDNLKANNYICHFSTFSRELLDKAGWYDSKYDGSQDHDLILRLTENAKKVSHIQEVLYFWRSHPGSVAEDINSKTYAIDAGKRAVHDCIERSGMSAAVESSKAFPTIYRIKYELTEKPLISIVIPNCNHKEDLKRCIESVLNKSTYKNYEILIIENNSTDEEIFEYYKEIETASNINVLKWDKPFNYSAINNFAVRYAKGDYLLFLNNDIEVITPEWIEELLMYGQRTDVAAVGAKLYYPDNTIQHAGIILGMGAHRVAGHCHYKCERNNLGYMGRLYYAQNMSAVTAACMLMRKSIFEEVGGFDEEFVIAYNDIDLCVKALNKGYTNIFTPHAELYHYESATRGLEDTPEKQERFMYEVNKFKDKWYDVLKQGDRYFNKNFSLDSSWFEVEENNLFRDIRR